MRVEFVRLQIEGPLERFVDRIAEGVAIFVNEIAQPFPPVLLLHVLENGVTEAIGEVAAALRMRDGRNLIVDDGIAQDHAVLRVLVIAHERGQPFHQPCRRIGRDLFSEFPLEKNFVLENVRELVLDELQKLLVRRVDGNDHPIARRFRERSHAFRYEIQVDVGLLEGRMRGVIDDRDLFRDLEIEFAR